MTIVDAMRVMLITPPMVQFNAPYAAVPMLAGHLRAAGVEVSQVDMSLQLALRLFSRGGLEALRLEVEKKLIRSRKGASRHFVDNADRYIETVDEVISFMQGRTRSRAVRLIRDGRLPRGPRFRVLDGMKRAGIDPAKEDPDGYPLFLASLYLDDLADAVREGADRRFELSRYAERLALSARDFSGLQAALGGRPTLVERMLDEIVESALGRDEPELIGITIPFPGNLLGALRIARCAKRLRPDTRIAVGGGYVNTELRGMAEARVFDFFDFVSYDDGEEPITRICDLVAGKGSLESLVRTRIRKGGSVSFIDAVSRPLRHRDRAAPSYGGVRLGDYIRVAETANPMARLWSGEKWAKLQLAHGCYWRKCAFCDTRLDYISRFDPADASTVVRWIDDVRHATGLTRFHFVDEAAPPALLRTVAKGLLDARREIAWWTNIRFDTAFTPELCRLMARSGCVAVTGGLECAEASMLQKMHKGITLPGAARVCAAMSEAGVMVHAYLIYGFPGQDLRQVVDGLEYVRQLFEQGYLHSAYWHRFALTVHSPMGMAPEAFGVRLLPQADAVFAENELPFTTRGRGDLDAIGICLRKAVYNYMHGLGISEDVRTWFSGMRVPRPSLRADAVCRDACA
ncbi:MAG: radical SAM protein [Lentisphaerae bacterium]|nr:radical SAM protein [Lentisphaerota bacterium]